MVCNVITADKANRLFWLGRYAERVYISLHLLRRYYDKVLDGDISDLNEYYKCLGVNCSGMNQESEECQYSQLYDKGNNCSIASSLELTNDNGIVLRHDITSESLSYIHLSQMLIAECAEAKEKNITKLQPITDYMLSFFGSVDERVFDNRIRIFLKMGRLVENLDLHIRFNYPYFRIEEAFLSLKEYIERSESAVADAFALESLNELVSEERYADQDETYKERLLSNLNMLITV
ncbi:MAG: alpha-E domain-containing protein [Rikenellaceae bacterium]